MEEKQNKIKDTLDFQEKQIELMKEGRMYIRKQIVAFINEVSGLEVKYEDELNKILKSLPKEQQDMVVAKVRTLMYGAPKKEDQ